MATVASLRRAIDRVARSLQDDASRALIRQLRSGSVSAQDALKMVQGATPEVRAAALLGWGMKNSPGVSSAFDAFVRGGADESAVVAELANALGISVGDLAASDMGPAITRMRDLARVSGRTAQGAARRAAAAQAGAAQGATQGAAQGAAQATQQAAAQAATGAAPGQGTGAAGGNASGSRRSRRRAAQQAATGQVPGQGLGQSVQQRAARGPYSSRQRLRSNHSVLNIWESILSPDTFRPGPTSTARWRRIANQWSQGRYVRAALNTPGLIWDWVREGRDFRTQAIRGAAALFGVGSAWRMLTGGTPFTDDRGRFNIAGIPFI